MSDKQSSNLVRNRGSSLKEKFTWKLNKRATQSLKSRNADGNSKSKPLFSATNSSPDLFATNLLASGSSIPILTEGTVKLHQVSDTSDPNIFVKILQYTRALRSSETRHILLNNDDITSTTPAELFTEPMPYSSILQLGAVELKRDSYIYCVKILTSSLSILLQASNALQRDRWLHSIQWKKNVSNSRRILSNANDPEVLLKEFKELVKLTLASRLEISETHKILLDVVSSLLTEKAEIMNNISNEALIMELGPLLERNDASSEICFFFIKHCRQSPRSMLVIKIFTPIIQHILKNNKNDDSEKNAWQRTFVVEYILALRSQNNGMDAVRNFVHTMHGPLSQCPHQRILTSLITICNAAIYQCVSTDRPMKRQSLCKHRKSHLGSLPKITTRGSAVLNNKVYTVSTDPKSMKNILQENSNKEKSVNSFDDDKVLNTAIQPKGDPNLKETYARSEKRLSNICEDARPSLTENQLERLATFVEVLKQASTIRDWCAGLADLLQPLPFPKEAMENPQFTRLMYPIMEKFADDDRDSVIKCLLYSRGGKEGWMQVYSPGGPACEDEGRLFTKMMEALLKPGVQTGKLKKFMTSIAEWHLQVIIMLALRENSVMISVLRDMLEMGVLTDEQSQLQVISALRCTPTGKAAFNELKALLESLNDCEGPKEFTLAPNSTDSDLSTLLREGAWASLESLTLSFTHVTSQSAQMIGGLRNLKHLNLWGTNFDDEGLQTLCDNLNLESLNLCETMVTGEGIQCLEAMPSLKCLNLNSTDLSASTFLKLKKSLFNLVEYNIEYTDASADIENQ